MLLNTKKKTRVKFNPWLNTNRPSSNWAQKVKFICETVQILVF